MTLAVGMGQLALRCIHSQDDLRPSFVEIVKELKKLSLAHPEGTSNIQKDVPKEAHPMTVVPPAPQPAPKPAAVARPFIGAGPTPSWAAGAQVRVTPISQQERPERQNDRQEAPMVASSASPNPFSMANAQGTSAEPVSLVTANGMGRRFNNPVDPTGRQVVADGGRPFLVVGSRPSPDMATGANQRSSPQMNSFSQIGASLYAVADSVSDVPHPEAARWNSGCDDNARSSGYGERLVEVEPLQVTRPMANHHFTATEQSRVQAGEAPHAEQRHPTVQAEMQNIVQRCLQQVGNTGHAEHRGVTSSPPGQQQGLLGVVSPSMDDEYVDESPTSILDCGAPPQEQPPVSRGAAADAWSNLRPEAAASAKEAGKPFLLPFSAPTGAGHVAPMPQQLPGTSDPSGWPVAADGAAASGSRVPSTKDHDQEREALFQQLQDEMGFSRYQVTEAFKRCSTAEAAIDWILSPEREWDAAWS
jgi:hypothetical protein